MKVTRSKKRYIAAAIIVLLAVVVFIQYPGMLYVGIAESAAPLKFMVPIFLVITIVSIFVEVKEEKRILQVIITVILLLITVFMLVYMTELLTGGNLGYIILENTVAYVAVCGIVLALIMGGYAITGSLSWGIRIAAAVLLLFSVTSYFVLKHRGTPLVPEDIAAGETALLVIGNYKIELTEPIAAAGFIAVCACLLAGSIKLPKVAGNYQYAIRVMTLATIVAVSYGTITKSWFYRAGLSPNYFAQVENIESNGGLVNFMANIPDMIRRQPEGYSEEQLRAIADQYVSDTVDSASVKPDVILIMGESWGNVAPEGIVKTNQEVTPFINSFKDRTDGIYRNVIVSGYGGGTSLSEYQVLTGTSAAYGIHSAAFQFNMHEDIPSIVRSFKQLGYGTTAMHTGTATAWKRDQAFPVLGFDTWLSQDELQEEDSAMVRQYVSDSVIYDKMLSLLDEADKPQFLYGITIQGHGGYDVEGYESEIKIESPEGDYPRAEQYLGVLHESDRSLADFISELEKRERPTIVLAYGDHWPTVEAEYTQYVETAWLADKGYIENKNLAGYETFGVLWSNFDLPEEVTESSDTMSLNYLGIYLMKGAGLPLTGYQKFLLDSAAELPVTAVAGYMDGTGQYITGEKAKNKKVYSNQNILQYNLIRDPDHYPEDFYYLKEEKHDTL